MEEKHVAADYLVLPLNAVRSADTPRST